MGGWAEQVLPLGRWRGNRKKWEVQGPGQVGSALQRDQGGPKTSQEIFVLKAERWGQGRGIISLGGGGEDMVDPFGPPSS